MVVFKAESVDEWEDVVSNCFIPLSCISFQSGYRARMEHLAIGSNMSVSALWTAGTTVQRTERLANRSTSDDLHLSLQVASRGTIRQGRRMIAVRPGSVSIYATDAPYYQDYSEPGQKQLIVQVSRSALGLPAGSLDGLLENLQIPAADTTRVFFSFVAAAQKQVRDTDHQLSREETEIARDLAATMLRSASLGRRVVPRTVGGLLHSIGDFVDSNLSNVTVDDVAAEFFVSRRRLYDIFGRLETTPSDFLRTKRLAYAAARLADTAEPFPPIAEVAASAGFDDQTTFSRAFRREYGMTPREWRKGARASLTAA